KGRAYSGTHGPETIKRPDARGNARRPLVQKLLRLSTRGAPESPPSMEAKMTLMKRGSGAVGTWDPFRELEEMSHRLNSIFRPTAELGESQALAGFDWAPTVDISETDKAYLIRADLPGVAKEDMKITVENGMLTLRGDRRKRTEHKDEKVHRIESSYGSFMRQFTLPDDAKEEGVDAQVKEGCLEVTIPKSAEKKGKARTIDVH